MTEKAKKDAGLKPGATKAKRDFSREDSGLALLVGLSSHSFGPVEADRDAPIESG